MNSNRLGSDTAEGDARIILAVAKAIGALLELPDVLAALTETLAPIVHFDAVAIGILEGEAIRTYWVHVAGLSQRAGESPERVAARYSSSIAAEPPPMRLPVSQHPISEIIRTGQPFVASDLATKTHFATDEPLLHNAFRSYIDLPLVKQGELIGAIKFLSKQLGDYTAAQVRLLQGVADMVSLAVANALAFEAVNVACEEIERLKEQLQVENRLLQDELVQRANYEEIVGSSPALEKLLAAIEKVAATDSTVLVTGETGTGKELVAHAIHRRSPRAARALIKVNCAALPKELIASELFGHEKGAFTGAMQQRVGRFEAANGGTIFLDEIGELNAEMQVALLRVLQEKEFERVGGNRTIKTDVRVIAATNRDLQREVAAGRFRMDLYYRLNVFPLHVPALRERVDDIPVLVDYFAGRLGARMGKHIRQIERRSLEVMQAYSWPGNIRELQNVIERCVILADTEVLRLEPGMLAAETHRAEAQPARPVALEKSSALKAEIEAVLRETRGFWIQASRQAHPDAPPRR